MANINAHLPPVIAAPFHPPTENLQHDNRIKPVIPKTEIISSYTKLKDEENRTQFSAQARDIIQDEEKQTADESAHQESSPEQRRSQFFARRRRFISAAKSSDAKLDAVEDFKEVVSVIQMRYQNAVSPLPEPTVSYAI
jgi:hypothetical protein